MLTRLPSFFLLLIFAATSAGRSQTTTITVDEVLAKGDDQRLEQKVTYHNHGSRILEVLAKLSELTGVTLIAGVDGNDWMVYDRKLIVHVTDMRLVDLMREISSVLRFRWSRDGEAGKWTYRLWQDKEQRAEEESLRSAAESAQSRELREKRENVIADLVNLSSLSEKDAAELKSRDPWRYILATEPLGKDVAEFINAFPEARNALVQGLEATFPASSLPPVLQEAIRRIATSYNSLLHSIGASEDHSALLARFDKLQITINRRRHLEPRDALSKSVLGRITIGSGSDSLDIPLLDPSSRMASALGKAIVALKSGVSKEEVAKQLQVDLAGSIEPPASPSGSARDIASDPALQRKITLFRERTTATLPVTLAALAERAGLNVVSDYFLAKPVLMEPGEKTVGEHLESIRSAYGSNWEKSGSTIRFRDREWFKKRTWEVPQVWIDYWTERGRLNDGLQFSDLVQIANLRDEQIDHTIMLTPSLVNMGVGLNLGPSDGGRNRNILRFYGMLGEDQRTALTTKHLEASKLSDVQWSALQKALAATGSAYAAASKGSQTIRLDQSGTGVTDYTFYYYPGGNEPPVTFKITTGVAFVTSDDVVFPKKKVVVPAPAE
ncbi:MAG: hypothetical protein N3B12_01725 [Armatimonadetes bacterium]|nr:hypothetical protein [Armatimonadota bacterium]